ncbi:MAG: hypothetical protein HDR20_00195 [Lachnospiraceae bacterium]|nr:hypothetical protein [Lachnospiraceae bacterium]
MGEIFRQILNLSITGSFLIAAVIVVRFLLQKGSRNMICILWILVGIRLLIPVSIESAFGVVPAGEVVTYSAWQDEVPIVDTGLEMIDNAVNRQILTSYTAGESESSLTVWDLCSYIWIAGMLLLTGYFVLSWHGLKKKVRMAVPDYQCGEKVYLCDDIPSPFLMGIVRPRIYLPRGMSEDAIPYVVAHETAHKKRRDYLIKWIASLLLIVYWFNPLIWISYVLFSRDMEFACDERVIRQMGAEHRKNYSNALLGCALGEQPDFWCPTAFGEVGVKSRILKVLHYKKPAFWEIVATTVLILLTAVCFLTQRKETPREGSVIAYKGYEFILEEALACKETGFIRVRIRVCGGENPEANVRDLKAYITPMISAQIGAKDLGENEWEIRILGCCMEEMDQALMLKDTSEETVIGTFSAELIQYEEAKEFIIDSYAGKIDIQVSAHSMEIFLEDGLPGRKEKGILAMEMKNGERWKATRIPLSVSGETILDFPEELRINAGMEREEDGIIFIGYEGPLNLEAIQSFVLVPEKRK